MRIGFYVTLQEMGADVTFANVIPEGGDTIADIRACYSPKLKGVRVPANRAPSMIDEYPILAVISAFAAGETHMDGLAEFKAKEGGCLAGTASGLDAMGSPRRSRAMCSKSQAPACGRRDRRH